MVIKKSYIRRIGNQFPQKYLLVTVEGINDQTHQLSDFCLESKSLSILLVGHLQGEKYNVNKRVGGR